MAMRPAAPALILLAALLCTSCTLGPRVLKGNRADYNTSINASNNEEMLLNLVRLRHFDAPFFLNVASVSSSFSVSVSTGFDVKFNAGPIEGYRGQYPYSAATPTVGAQYGETPTVIYVPLSGEKFATQLLTEISLERLLFLTRAGWDMEMLLRLLVKQVGPCVNKSVAMDTELNLDPARTRAFDDLAALLKRLQARGDLELAAVTGPAAARTPVSLQLRFRDREEAREAERLLSLNLPLKPGPGGGPGSALVARIGLSQDNDLAAANTCDGETCRVPVRLRNFIGVLDGLAQGVDLPRGDVGTGAQVRETPVPFKVSTASSQPSAAFVSARYDGQWYFIEKNDAGSRKVFSFLNQLFALEGGELPKTSPVLTLPVSR